MLLFLLVSSLSVNWVFAGSDYTDKDMAEVADWLKQQAENGDGTSKNFLELPSVLSSKKCDKSGAETLDANDRLVKALASNQSVDKSMVLKIENIIKSYQERFSVMCYRTYSSLVDKKMDAVDRESKKYVMQLAQPGMVGVGALKYFLAQDQDHDDVVHIGPGFDAKHQPINRGVFEKYMVRPCRELEENVSKDYYDASKIIVLARGRNAELASDAKFKNLSKNYSAMKACRNIVEDVDKIWHGMEEYLAKDTEAKRVRAEEHEAYLEEQAKLPPPRLVDLSGVTFFGRSTGTTSIVPAGVAAGGRR